MAASKACSLPCGKPISATSPCFSAPIRSGDTLTATLTVEAVRDAEVDLSIRTVNQAGDVVLTGEATARGRA